MRDGISDTPRTTISTRPLIKNTAEHTPVERPTTEITPKEPVAIPRITHKPKQLAEVRGIFSHKQTGDPELLLRQLSQHRPRPVTEQQTPLSQDHVQPEEPTNATIIHDTDTRAAQFHTPNVDRDPKEYKNTEQQLITDKTSPDESSDSTDLTISEKPRNHVELLEQNLEEIIDEETESSEELLFIKEQLALSQERYHELALAMVDALKTSGIQLNIGESEKEKEEQQSFLLLFLYMFLLIMQAAADEDMNIQNPLTEN